VTFAHWAFSDEAIGWPKLDVPRSRNDPMSAAVFSIGLGGYWIAQAEEAAERRRLPPSAVIRT
jgi:hypothetical protein